MKADSNINQSIEPHVLLEIMVTEALSMLPFMTRENVGTLETILARRDTIDTNEIDTYIETLSTFLERFSRIREENAERALRDDRNFPKFRME